jgi:GNAT superfamily N-acetyltransferase
VTDPRIRPITPADVPAVVAMVHELAEYERAPRECQLTDEQLLAALFAPAPALHGHVAVDAGGAPVGFALWFLNFSTWRGVHGIYLEDLYVRPAARGSGLGRELLATLARTCVERGYARLDWWVLDWNTPARDVYYALGGRPMEEWVPYRLDGDALNRLGGAAPSVPAPSGNGHAAGSPSTASPS